MKTPDVLYLLNTLKFLRPIQLFYQVGYRIKRIAYVRYSVVSPPSLLLCTSWIDKPQSYYANYFSFLNIDKSFASWNDKSNGNLWSYNLNYMDWLNQDDMTIDEGSRWINRFIDEIGGNKVGLDPYPIALRGINWIKFISKHHDNIEPRTLIRWNSSLYSQYKLLTKKLEYHLLGNHLLEDAYSLFIASLYFKDESFFKKSASLLNRELHRQILPDGAHFEQSPMYHCILLDRLLDCYNLSIHNPIFRGQSDVSDLFRSKASLMLGHLDSIIYNDGSFPLMNDAAEGIAPNPKQLFDYAERLHIDWQPIRLNECGYRLFKGLGIEVLIDVGNITATYQPGHTHADTFNYELRINSRPFIVDTGISTYEKNARRQYERSTAAHNTVTIDDKDSSEVWGGFRVGKRARVRILEDSESRLRASMTGFGRNKIHTREFRLQDKRLDIIDRINNGNKGLNYIHFSSEVEVLSSSDKLIETNMGVLNIEGAYSVEIIDEYISTEYNRLLPAKVAKIGFNGKMKYSIDITYENTFSK